MPYIKQDDRMKFDPVLQEFGRALASHKLSDGDMNYLITSMMHEWIMSRGLRYTNLNSAIGIMECIKLELYRRVAAPYENKKIAENGDVLGVDPEPEGTP